MEIKKGQIWRIVGLSEKSVVEVTSKTGNVVFFEYDGEETRIKDRLTVSEFLEFHEFVRNKGDVSRKFEINEAKEIIVKADKFTINDVEVDEAWIKDRIKERVGVVHPKENVLKKHNHYFKDVSDYKEIDVYALCKIFEIDDPTGCTHHAIKKLLAAGKRGHKDRLTDLQNVVDTVKRLIELESGNE